MENEILEGNKLIAESPFSNLVRGSSTKERWYIKSNGQQGYFTKLKYHSSWDWLMPVVENIMMLHWNDRQNMFDVDVNRFYENDIDAVWSAVVEFIKWYNQNAEK